LQKHKHDLQNMHDLLEDAYLDKDTLEANMRQERDAHNREVSNLTGTIDKLRTDLSVAIPSDEVLDSISITDLSTMLEANTAMGVKIKNAILKKTTAIVSNGSAETAVRVMCPVCSNIHAKPNIVANCCGKLLCTSCVTNWGVNKYCCYCRNPEPHYTRLADTVFN
jgi:hypothetical protein